MRILKNKFAVIALIILVGLIIFLFVRSRSKSPITTTVPEAQYKTLLPGTSTRKDVLEKLGQPLGDTAADLLNFKSTNPNLPNQVAVSGDTVQFIREIVTAKDNRTTTDIASVYGTAPVMLYGSDSVNGFNLYVYPDMGIAYLGHVKEPVLLEVWYFQPTTITDFQTRWAPEYSTVHRPIQ